MRVISGAARGRPLKAVPGMGTRPTTDKVKEAIFSMIGPYFDGGSVLDLFAGTGGLGIEALSRGMDHGVFVDLDSKSAEVVRANLASTNLTDKAEVYKNEAMRALKALVKRQARFDLVFLDPPYRMKQVEEYIGWMQEYGLLNKGAIAVVEHESAHRYGETIGSMAMMKRADYGETAVTVYRDIGGSSELKQVEGDTEQ